MVVTLIANIAGKTVELFISDLKFGSLSLCKLTDRT